MQIIRPTEADTSPAHFAKRAGSIRTTPRKDRPGLRILRRCPRQRSFHLHFLRRSLIGTFKTESRPDDRFRFSDRTEYYSSGTDRTCPVPSRVPRFQSTGEVPAVPGHPEQEKMAPAAGNSAIRRTERRRIARSITPRPPLSGLPKKSGAPRRDRDGTETGCRRLLAAARASGPLLPRNSAIFRPFTDEAPELATDIPNRQRGPVRMTGPRCLRPNLS